MGRSTELPFRLGRYRVLERLGQGGMATVYRAEDEELRRAVAIKVMHPHLVEKGTGTQARFAREARAVAALRHANVLAVYDYVAAPAEGEAPAFLVMELLSGPSLRRFLDDHGAPLPEVAAMIGVKLAEALAAAHAHDIVHRDLKPENVMLDGGRVVLCDFGIARVTSVDSTQTATGAILGTPAFMSPEQANGDEIDARSDLFSLGTVLYQLATGQLPFTAREPLVILNKIVKAEHLPPSVHNPRVPPYLERVIEKLLRRDRDDRYQTAKEVAAALEKGLAADGFRELEKEIARYFVDPPGYNAEVEPRIVATSLEAARAAAERGQVPQALALCNRVLAWRPDDAGAQTIIRRIGRQGRARRLLLWGGAAAAVLLVGGMGGRALVARWHAAPVPSLAATTAAHVPSVAVQQSSAALPQESLALQQAPAATAAPATAGTPSPAAAGPLPPSTAALAAGAPAIAAPSSAPASPTLASAPASKAASHHGGARSHGAAPAVASPAAPVAAAPAPPSPAAAAPVERPPAAVEKPAAAPPSDGELVVRARPYCDGTVDGSRPIKEGQPLRLAVGEHRVRCAGPGGRSLERSVTVTAGARVEASFDFNGRTTVTPHLTRGDAIAFGDAAPSTGPQQVTPGIERSVRLFKAGQEIDRARIDVPPGECDLRDAPRLECRKP